jgi:hypothetical protein
VVASIIGDLDCTGAGAAATAAANAAHGTSHGGGGGGDGGGKIASPELPFIPDEDEDKLISAVSKAESVLLVGRSGTGKTSIAIGRMFAMYSQVPCICVISDAEAAPIQLRANAWDLPHLLQVLAAGRAGCYICIHRMVEAALQLDRIQCQYLGSIALASSASSMAGSCA